MISTDLNEYLKKRNERYVDLMGDLLTMQPLKDHGRVKVERACTR